MCNSLAKNKFCHLTHIGTAKNSGIFRDKFGSRIKHRHLTSFEICDIMSFQGEMSMSKTVLFFLRIFGKIIVTRHRFFLVSNKYKSDLSYPASGIFKRLEWKTEI